MNAYYKKRDPGRLVHYEGVFQNRDYEDNISDVESQMYAPPGRVREYLENEPKNRLSCVNICMIWETHLGV